MISLYPYERRIVEAEEMGIIVQEMALDNCFKGLYIDNIIALEDKLSYTEKNCIMAEEIGHAVVNTGNIIDQTLLINRKQEHRGRIYAYMKLISLQRIVEAYQAGCANRFEAAEYLDVTEKFFMEAVNYYYKMYGIKAVEGEYIIFFSESGVRVKRKGWREWPA